jgi:hypothetical protein
MILSSPVDDINQAAPVTTTFDPALGATTMGVASECKAISLPAEDPRPYSAGDGTWRRVSPRPATD